MEATTAALDEVRQLADGGHVKSALRKAKHIHRRVRTAQSESLLIDAYLARISALTNTGLFKEAKSLLERVDEQFPSTRQRLRLWHARLLAKMGRLSELVAPLTDPNLGAEDRLAIDQIIRQEVVDPESLASCSALSPDHPLRRGAAAVAEAFRAVTSGPVSDRQIALMEVSRQNPLAPWKLLVRAIALFYRQDQHGYQRCLAGIDQESAPARLISVLDRLLGKQRSDRGMDRARDELCAAVKPDHRPLRQALGRLDRAMDDGSLRSVQSNIRGAVKLCSKHRPDLLDKLRQHISIAGVLNEIPADRINWALGKPSLKNAGYWRLFARALETMSFTFQACSLWEQFRHHAVHEGWFAADGPEVAALYVHMANQLRRVPNSVFRRGKQDFCERFEGYGPCYDDQSPEIRRVAPQSDEPTDFYFVSPADLYRRATRVVANSKIFGQWLDWAQQFQRDDRLADEAATVWHQVIPTDTRPLLHLMESAERRRALKKALDYLEKAEALDAVNPQVRMARLRLWMAIAVRHIKDGKLRLAKQDLAEIAALPQIQEADRPAMLGALRAIFHLRGGDPHNAFIAREQVARQLANEAAADLMVQTLAGACRLNKTAALSTMAPQRVSGKARGELIEAVGRVCAMAEEVGLAVQVPKAWHKPLMKELTSSPCRAEPVHLIRLARAALGQDKPALAYAAAGAGLQRHDGAAGQAQLLLIRAQCLPPWEHERHLKCCRVAAELARRARDEPLAGQAFELAQAAVDPWDDLSDYWKDSVSDEELEAVLLSEQQTTRLPTYSFGPSRAAVGVGRGPNSRYRQQDSTLFDFLDDEPDSDPLDEPPKRRRRTYGQSSTPTPPGFHRDLDPDVEEMVDQVLPSDCPTQALPLLMKLFTKHLRPDGSMPSLKQVKQLDPELVSQLFTTLGVAQFDGAESSGPIRPKRRKHRRKGKRHK